MLGERQILDLQGRVAIRAACTARVRHDEAGRGPSLNVHRLRINFEHARLPGVSLHHYATPAVSSEARWLVAVSSEARWPKGPAWCVPPTVASSPQPPAAAGLEMALRLLPEEISAVPAQLAGGCAGTCYAENVVCVCWGEGGQPSAPPRHASPAALSGGAGKPVLHCQPRALLC